MKHKRKPKPLTNKEKVYLTLGLIALVVKNLWEWYIDNRYRLITPIVLALLIIILFNVPEQIVIPVLSLSFIHTCIGLSVTLDEYLSQM